MGDLLSTISKRFLFLPFLGTLVTINQHPPIPCSPLQQLDGDDARVTTRAYLPFFCRSHRQYQNCSFFLLFLPGPLPGLYPRLRQDSFKQGLVGLPTLLLASISSLIKILAKRRFVLACRSIPLSRRACSSALFFALTCFLFWTII